jgi:perosamine synthetase
LFKICWNDDDVSAVTSVIKSGAYWTTGPKIREFEAALSKFTGTKYALTFNSGTSALHAALISHGIKGGDEVIVPSFTFISTANAVLFEKAKPVFADIEPKTLGLDPNDVMNKITKKTKAIIPVHVGGLPCLIEELSKIADDNNLLLIEDAAESLGSSVNNRKIGTFGKSSMFSFCQNKIITTGDGGAIITDSESIYNQLKLVRSHGRNEPTNYFSSGDVPDYVTLGYNYRMPDILAALGQSQLQKIYQIIDMRRRNALYLSNALQDIEEIIPPYDFTERFNVYQLYTIQIKDSAKRDALSKYLNERGISTKIYFSPIHLTKFYKDLGYHNRLPVTEDMASRVLTLPMYPDLSKEEMDYIVTGIKSFFGVY